MVISMLSSSKGDFPASIIPEAHDVLEIPDGTEVIRDFAFSTIPWKIRKLIIPPSVKKIKKAAFKNCGIEEIQISEEGRHLAIDCECFQGNKISKLEIPERVWYIGLKSFAECNSLVEIKGGEGLKIIYKEAFAKTGLKKLDLSSSVILEEIREKAFAYSSIEELHMPFLYAEADIKENAFEGCNIKKVFAARDVYDESDLSNIEGLKKAQLIMY